jgi:hypothetical protein
MQYLDGDQAHLVIEVAWRMFFLGSLLGRIRRGELVGLEWHSVSCEDHSFSIQQSISHTPRMERPWSTHRKPNHPCVYCMVGEHGSPEHSRQMAALSKHRELVGLSPEIIEHGMKRMEATPIVPESRVLDLVQTAGFGNVLTFYGSYLLRGWVATKM